ncbi:MAG: hypothetical protein M1438_01355 [Deltaproteobacteria bacterium]|nr:hypothetical protein [Deltaproteobacteria bacterium]
MNQENQTLCSMPGVGFCIYDRCPYWDKIKQECDADCLQSRIANESEIPEDCCIIHWTEDFD